MAQPITVSYPPANQPLDPGVASINTWGTYSGTRPDLIWAKAYEGSSAGFSKNPFEENELGITPNAGGNWDHSPITVPMVSVETNGFIVYWNIRPGDCTIYRQIVPVIYQPMAVPAPGGPPAPAARPPGAAPPGGQAPPPPQRGGNHP